MEAAPHGGPAADRGGSTVDGEASDLPYVLDTRLGGSGGTEVWVAHARGDATPIALKLMRDADRSPLDSYRHELEIARGLDHPALVRVRDFGESARGTYVAMDLVQPGIPLSALIARQRDRRMPLSPAVVAYIGISVAEALDHAATRAKMDGLAVRLVHRHLSPNNVLLDAEGRVRVADLAVPASRTAVSPASGARVRGTPGYLAPEQVRDGVVDERSDVFALGTILHECSTLEAVFARGDVSQAMVAVLDRAVPPLSDTLSAFPAVLSRAIAKAMSASPTDRPQDIGELKVALREAVPTVPGYTDARSTLAGQVAGALRALKTESEARTALIDETRDGPRTMPLEAQVIELPPNDGVQHRSVPLVKALADAELSEDSANSADEPTGALLLPPPARALPPPSDERSEDTPFAPPSAVYEIPRTDVEPPARVSDPRSTADEPARPPPLVTPRTPTTPVTPAPPPVRRVSASVTPRTPTRQTPVDPGWLVRLSTMLEDPAQRTPFVAAFVVILVVLLGVLLWTRSAPAHDEALRALYAQADYAGAEAYFVAHAGEFRDPAAAFELAADAWRRARADTLVPLPAREAEAPRPSPRLTASTTAALALPNPLANVAVPAEIPEPAARTKPDRRARARAKKSRDAAQHALEAGDLVLAERHLRRCVATFDGPACRLQLGLLHARAGELEEASIHFERYLEQWPEAPDADQIRAALAALPPPSDAE